MYLSNCCTSSCKRQANKKISDLEIESSQMIRPMQFMFPALKHNCRGGFLISFVHASRSASKHELISSSYYDKQIVNRHYGSFNSDLLSKFLLITNLYISQVFREPMCINFSFLLLQQTMRCL